MSDVPPTGEPVQQNRPFSIEVAERVRRLPPYLFAQINRLKDEKRRAGDDVIDLGMGNPSDPPQDLVVEKLAEAARDPKNHGYSEAMGILSLRREVAAKYFKRHGVRLDPQREVVVCLGSKEGFSHLCLALLGPGDTAIVPAPSYPAHIYAVALAAANAILLEVTETEKLLANVDYTCRHMVPRPKVWILNFPHNPSTTVVEPEFYVEVVELAKQYGFMVISDLAYADVDLRRLQDAQFPGRPGAQGRGRRIDHHEQGLQHGRLADRLLRRQRRNGPRPGHDQGLLRLRHVSPHPDRRHHGPPPYGCGRGEPRRPSTSVGATCSATAWNGSAGPSQRPKATMFVWAKIPEPWASQMTSIDLAMKLLQEGDVAVSPGGGFGPAGEGYLRLALVENENRLRQAVRQIGRCLGQGIRD